MRTRTIVGVIGTGIAGALGAVLAAPGCVTVQCSDDPLCALQQACAADSAADAKPDGCQGLLGLDGASEEGSADTGDSATDAQGDSSADVNAGDVSESDAPDGALDGGEEDADAADAPPPCDAVKTPAEDACVISETYGVFVSPSGSDANAGTRTAPLRTLAAGLTMAKAESKRLYACTGTYAEALVVTASLDGVAAYGGLDCTMSAWPYTAGAVAAATPTTQGYALSVTGVTTGVTFEDFSFTAQAGTALAPSSIAVSVSGSQNVTFVRTTMQAGKGAGGASGASGGPNPDGGTSQNPTNWFGTPPDYAELNGSGAGASTAGALLTCTCHDTTTSTGGQGGIASSEAGNGLPSYEAGAGVAGMNVASCAPSGAGLDGANAPQSPADTSSTAVGALASSGWSPASGVSGSNGQPGQGGGGGGDGKNDSGFGGGGACGGCGGSGGKAGAGGGASIALASVASAVTLTSCTLQASAGGQGGPGGAGEPGQSGGLGGNPSAGCQGGAGGNGSGGNGAQGGPGGVSLGIAFTGTAPIVDGSPVSASTPTLTGVTVSSTPAIGGIGGPGGTATSTTAGADGGAGPVGISQAAMGF